MSLPFLVVGVAQLVRAPGCGPGGRGFESLHSPHFLPFFFAPPLTLMRVSSFQYSPLFILGTLEFRISDFGLRIADLKEGSHESESSIQYPASRICNLQSKI